ncbi:MAG: 30S ribosomal protein S2 [Patescibacteria group bacterium]
MAIFIMKKEEKNNKIQMIVAEEELKENEVIESEADIEVLKEMMSAGLMYGHKTSKTNPKFRPYIALARNGMEIIDLAKTLSAIDSAAEFLSQQIKNKKMVIIVATQPAAWDVAEVLAKKFDLPYVKNRWIGGLITNFKILSLRVEHFKKIQADMAKGEYEKYTKKERSVINKQIEKMRILFGGLENLTRVPEAMFVVDLDIKGHNTAIREARRMKVPVVAIIDSDDNPDLIDYPIPANDHAKASIEWIINKIVGKISSDN